MSIFEQANENFINNNYDEAIKLYNEAYEEKEGSTSNKFSCLFNIGVCYLKKYFSEKEDIYLESALMYFKDAIGKHKEVTTIKKANVYHNIAVVYARMKDLKKAYIYENIASTFNNEDEDILRGLNKIEEAIKKTIIEAK